MDKFINELFRFLDKFTFAAFIWISIELVDKGANLIFDIINTIIDINNRF